MMDRPSLIQARHLEKLAVVYVRQSSPHQVQKNLGSAEVQRGLIRLAEEWGWDPSRIVLIEDDLGRSASVAGQRSGFRRLLHLIDQGEVALVLLHDFSRASRNTQEGEEFLSRVLEQQLLVWLNGKLFNGASEELAELFDLRLQNLLAWWDQANRTRTLRLARLATVSNKHLAVTVPPTGLVVVTRGKWVVDPDPEIREALSRVFRLYLRFRRGGDVLGYYREHGLQHPYRRKGIVVWEPIRLLDIYRILRNPNYTPDYVFRRMKRSSTGHQVKMDRSGWLVIRDHHEAIVSREDWELIQELLDRNRVGRGALLFQGEALSYPLVWCDRCGRPVKVKYDRRLKDRRLPIYLCRYFDGYVTHHCFRLPAEHLDAVVIREVLSTVGPAALNELEAILASHAKEQEATQRSQLTQLERADIIVADAKRRYNAVDPVHALVKAELERDFQETIRARDELRRSFTVDDSARRAHIFTPEELKRRFLALVPKSAELWNAPTTTNEDRKRLIQALVKRIAVTSVTDEAVTIEMQWVGGATEPYSILRGKGVRTFTLACRNNGWNGTRIAEELNAQGVTVRAGRPISRDGASARSKRMGFDCRALWKAALTRISELVLAGWRAEQILEELKTNGPRNWLNEWTLSKVKAAIYNLRRKSKHGIPRLPPHRQTTHETSRLGRRPRGIQ